jgi:hypothetical protein
MWSRWFMFSKMAASQYSSPTPTCITCEWHQQRKSHFGGNFFNKWNQNSTARKVVRSAARRYTRTIPHVPQIFCRHCRCYHRVIYPPNYSGCFCPCLHRMNGRPLCRRPEQKVLQRHCVSKAGFRVARCFERPCCQRKIFHALRATAQQSTLQKRGKLMMRDGRDAWVCDARNWNGK